MIDQTRLQEIRDRVEAASPGPWSSYEEDDGLKTWIQTRANPQDGTQIIAHLSMGPNADFIAHSREDVQDLLTEVERLITYVGLVFGTYLPPNERA